MSIRRGSWNAVIRFVKLSDFVPVFKVIFVPGPPALNQHAAPWCSPVGSVNRIRSAITPRRDLLSSTGRHCKTQNRCNCRSKEQFSLNFLKAILFSTVGHGANIRLSDGNKIA